MLGSATLDLAIGMAFIFLMLSFIVAALREAIEVRLKDRALFLQRGLLELLGRDVNFVNILYKHPLISALYSGDYVNAEKELLKSRSQSAFDWIRRFFASYKKGTASTQLPSYIPTRTAVLAIIDMARTSQLCASPATPPPMPDCAISIAKLREELKNQCQHKVVQGISAAISAVGDDTEKGLKSIEAWYDASMDRVSGWFKRETQSILFMLGFLVAVALNVDAIFLTKFLASSPEARNSLVAQVAAIQNSPELTNRIKELRDKENSLALGAGASLPAAGASAAASEPSSPLETAIEARIKKLGINEENYQQTDKKVSKAIKNFSDLNLPLGWSRMRWVDFTTGGLENGFWTIIGWFTTAFALSFGAPFWFDVLNKFMVIRSTVKPHEKSPEEASEDRHNKPAGNSKEKI